MNKEERAIIEWLNASEDQGASSQAVAFAALCPEGVTRLHHPYDPSDLGRCLGLLKACPHAMVGVKRLADRSPCWKVYLENWHRLVGQLEAEKRSRKDGKAPLTYEAMRGLQALVARSHVPDDGTYKSAGVTWTDVTRKADDGIMQDDGLRWVPDEVHLYEVWPHYTAHGDHRGFMALLNGKIVESGNDVDLDRACAACVEDYSLNVDTSIRWEKVDDDPDAATWEPGNGKHVYCVSMEVGGWDVRVNGQLEKSGFQFRSDAMRWCVKHWEELPRTPDPKWRQMGDGFVGNIWRPESGVEYRVHAKDGKWVAKARQKRGGAFTDLGTATNEIDARLMCEGHYETLDVPRALGGQWRVTEGDGDENGHWYWWPDRSIRYDVKPVDGGFMILLEPDGCAPVMLRHLCDHLGHARRICEKHYERVAKGLGMAGTVVGPDGWAKLKHTHYWSPNVGSVWVKGVQNGAGPHYKIHEYPDGDLSVWCGVRRLVKVSAAKGWNVGRFKEMCRAHFDQERGIDDAYDDYLDEHGNFKADLEDE